MLTVLDKMMTPLDRHGRPLGPVVIGGYVWMPVVLTDSARCRECRVMLRAGRAAYECPAAVAGFLCGGCAG